MCYLNSSRDHTTLDWSAQIQYFSRNDQNLIWLSKPGNSKINTLWDTLNRWTSLQLQTLQASISVYCIHYSNFTISLAGRKIPMGEITVHRSDTTSQLLSLTGREDKEAETA